MYAMGKSTHAHVRDVHIACLVVISTLACVDIVKFLILMMMMMIMMIYDKFLMRMMMMMMMIEVHV